MNVLLVFVGGGLGSVFRYAVSLLTPHIYSGNFPLATFLSNILACSILALAMWIIQSDAASQSWIHPFVAVGICGGFSTFSTFSMETVTLVQSGYVWLATLNILLSLSVGLALLVAFLPKS
jgi:CrcB protein